jgi:hypothetical protein
MHANRGLKHPSSGSFLSHEPNPVSHPLIPPLDDYSNINAPGVPYLGIGNSPIRGPLFREKAGRARVPGITVCVPLSRSATIWIIRGKLGRRGCEWIILERRYESVNLVWKGGIATCGRL